MDNKCSRNREGEKMERWDWKVCWYDMTENNTAMIMEIVGEDFILQCTNNKCCCWWWYIKWMSAFNGRGGSVFLFADTWFDSINSIYFATRVKLVSKIVENFSLINGKSILFFKTGPLHLGNWHNTIFLSRPNLGGVLN